MGLFDRGRNGAPGGSGRSGDAGGPVGRVKEAGGDAVQLTIDYLKQETLGPLKGVGRFLAFGVLGSLALCVGVVLLLVGLLRLLQGETGTTFAGNLSWLPYLIVSVVAAALIGLTIWRIAKGPAARRLPVASRAGDAGGSGRGGRDGGRDEGSH
ncbi:MAG TPA: hypothetical protein VHB02_11775 [Acidimicrobiales bacterium]|nr:hypothetical protein [Acidimicrobiales bacterium]